jgi:ribosomal protein S18 acetylase RimI-like enzyme
MKTNPHRQEVQIREVQPEEIAQLSALSAATFYETFAAQNNEHDMRAYLQEAFSEARLTQELQQAGSTFYFAWRPDEPQPLGYLKLNTGAAQSEDMGNDSLEIERLYVRGVYQGTGTGAALMERALAAAQQLGKHNVWLGVSEHNHKAIRFYQAFGFRITGTHVFQLGSDAQTDCIMQRSV